MRSVLAWGPFGRLRTGRCKPVPLAARGRRAHRLGVVEFGSVFPNPLLDIVDQPDLAHLKYVVRLGEGVAGDELLDALATDATEAVADLACPHQVLPHERQHRTKTTCTITTPAMAGPL